MSRSNQDSVNHPAHYKAGGIEVIDVIEKFELGYRLGNVVKYILRAGRKTASPREDLAKARWYLDRELASLPPALDDVLPKPTYEDYDSDTSR